MTKHKHWWVVTWRNPPPNHLEDSIAGPFSSRAEAAEYAEELPTRVTQVRIEDRTVFQR